MRQNVFMQQTTEGAAPASRAREGRCAWVVITPRVLRPENVHVAEVAETRWVCHSWSPPFGIK
jgi:hypothetical protein